MKVDSISPIQTSQFIPNSPKSRIGKLGLLAIALVAFNGQVAGGHTPYGTYSATSKLDSYTFTYKCNLSVEANAIAASAGALYDTKNPSIALEIGKIVSNRGNVLETAFFNKLATTLITREILIEKCQSAANAFPVKFSAAEMNELSRRPNEISYSNRLRAEAALTYMKNYDFIYQCSLPVTANAIKASAEVLFNTQNIALSYEIGNKVTDIGKLLSAVFFNDLSRALFTEKALTSVCQIVADVLPYRYRVLQTGSLNDVVISWFH